jgi:hypothetical protein
MNIIDRYRKIENEAAETAINCGRDPGSIRIIAVTKTHPVQTVQYAVDSGIFEIGESKVQEAKTKFSGLRGDYSAHMIGHLQSNKSKEAVMLFEWIHSLDKETTAIALNSEAQKIGKIQKVLIQVNTSGETTKSGIKPERAAELAETISNLKNLELKGLMTIGPFTYDTKEISSCFAETKKLLDEISHTLQIKLNELSMGMSTDFKTAIREGSTMIRIGTAIFGDR